MARRKPAYPTDTNASSGSGYTGPQALERDSALIWWPMQSEPLPTTALTTIVDPGDPTKNSLTQSANNTEIDDFVSGERMVRWGNANLDSAIGAAVTNGATISCTFHRNAVVGTTNASVAVFEGANRVMGVRFNGGNMESVVGLAWTAFAGLRSSRIDTIRVTIRRSPPDGGGNVVDEIFVNNRKVWTTAAFIPTATTAACVLRFGDASANPPARDLQFWLESRTDAQIKAQVDRYQPWLA